MQVVTTTYYCQTDIAFRGPAAHSTYTDGKGWSAVRFLSRLGSAIGPLSGKPIGRINGKNTQGALSLCLRAGRIEKAFLQYGSGLENGMLSSCSGYLCD
jgi:hypothetical protein